MQLGVGDHGADDAAGIGFHGKISFTNKADVCGRVTVSQGR